MSWANDYVGIPWRLHGRDRRGCDCWGLACTVYRDRGITLPEYLDYGAADDHGEIAALIAGATSSPIWQLVETPEPFDIAVFRRGRLDTHVGIVVAPGRMLHMADEDCAKIERYDGGAWRHRLTGHWRHAGVETAAPALVSVLATPLLDPGAARIEMELPHGLSVADMVKAAMPGVHDLEHVTVTLVTERGAMHVSRSVWGRVKPRAGVRVVIRVIPGKSSMRTVLAIAVTVAAVAMGAYFAGTALPTMLGLSPMATQGLVSAGVTALGNLAINALVPPNSADKAKPKFEISGWRNRLDPDGPVPVVLGSVRMAPPFAATSWTEIVGDWQYVRAMLCVGVGPVDIADLQIGETSIAEYDEVELEIREGRAGDPPVSLYPRQILEEPVGTELTRPMPRDDAGNVIDDNASIETPVVRTTAADTETASIILGWPAGLVFVNDEGDRRSEEVQIRIEQRLVTASSWQLVETLTVRAKKTEPFYRQHSWKLPSRGRWQVRLTMLTEEPANPGRQRRTMWVALQSIRPEYPLASKVPMALIGLRIKATQQLNGALDNVSAKVTRVCLDYDRVTGTWIERATSNPASLYRYVLQSPAMARPVADAGIDLAQLADWHEFCRIADLRYDREIGEADGTLRDVLTEVAAAGRATPRHDGLRWGVVIDRPQPLVVDHISPRNSRNFKATRSYFEPPHAFRAKFADADNDGKPAERLILWPGYAGPVTVTEAIDLPGKTRAAEVWREGRRRQYEALHRCDSYEVTQSGPVRVATRGDLVMLSHDVLDEVQQAARVVAVTGDEVLIDEPVRIEAGASYGVRWRSLSAGDTIGSSIVRPVTAPAGLTRVLMLLGTGAVPDEGDMLMFGKASEEARPAIVTAVEATQDMACILRLTDAAPEIDALLAADTPPAWSSRVGAELPASTLQPPQPRFAGVVSGAASTSTAGRVEIDLAPGSGPVKSDRYVLRHRVAGATSWSTVYFPVAQGGYVLSTYVTGTAIELQAGALSSTGVAGPMTAILPLVVGAGDAPLPGAIDATDVTVTALPGGIRVDFATASDPATTSVQIYRSTSGSLNRATDRAGEPVKVQPARRYTAVLGDGTRDNMLANPDMASSAVWSFGTGWSASAGTAVHTAGNATALTQSVTGLKVGVTYRIAYTASVSAGTVRAQIIGGSTRSGAIRASSGRFTDRLQAVTGNNAFRFIADAAYAGSIDNVLLYPETASCLDPGTHNIWLEAVNRDGLPGPVSGPFSVTVE